VKRAGFKWGDDAFLTGNPLIRVADPWLGLSVVAFVLAMLSFILLGVVAWRRPPARSDWLRIAPLFAASAALRAKAEAGARAADDTAARGAGHSPRILTSTRFRRMPSNSP
jgi:hypothetical protein